MIKELVVRARITDRHFKDWVLLLRVHIKHNLYYNKIFLVLLLGCFYINTCRNFRITAKKTPKVRGEDAQKNQTCKFLVFK